MPTGLEYQKLLEEAYAAGYRPSVIDTKKPDIASGKPDVVTGTPDVVKPDFRTPPAQVTTAQNTAQAGVINRAAQPEYIVTADGRIKREDFERLEAQYPQGIPSPAVQEVIKGYKTAEEIRDEQIKETISNEEEIMRSVALAEQYGTQIDRAAIEQSFKDIKSKAELIDTVKQAEQQITRNEQSWIQSGQMTPEVQKQFDDARASIEQAKAHVYGEASPYVDLAAGTVDIAGVLKSSAISDPEKALRDIGVRSIDIVKTKRAIESQKLEKEVQAQIKAIRLKDIKTDIEKSKLQSMYDTYQITQPKVKNNIAGVSITSITGKENINPLIANKDYLKAEQALSTVMDKIDRLNPNMTPAQREELYKKTPEYTAYVQAERTNAIADNTRVLQDIGREVFTAGKIYTPSFNKPDIEKQYTQQHDIALATFIGDLPKLKQLYNNGYFGKGNDAKQSYNDAVTTVKQQQAIEQAVRAGDQAKLRQLYKQGAFSEYDTGTFANLMKYVKEGGRDYASVTTEDIKAFNEAYGTKDDYVKTVLDSMPSLGELAKDFGIALVPVWGTIYHWDNMGGLGRGVSIVGDVLSIIPFVGGIAAAAKTAAGVGKMARLTAGLKVVPQLMKAEITAPFQALAHPVESLKAIRTTTGSIAKWAGDFRHIPQSTMSTVYSTVRLDASILGDTASTRFVRDTLMKQAATKGGKVAVQFGDKIIELRVPAFLRKGGTVHATPSAGFADAPGGFSVTAKLYPEGHPKAGLRMPDSEQGLFVANNALERFAVGGSAFGFEKTGGALDNLTVLKQAVTAADNAGDTSKVNKLQNLVTQYNDAIKAKNINKLNKVELKIQNVLTELAIVEKVDKVNDARKLAQDLYNIGDIKGSQAAMQEALSWEKALQPQRSGFLNFSPEISTLAVPSGKDYKGMVFQAGIDDLWSISITEMKKDKAALLLQQAVEAERLGDKVTAARLTKEAHDLIKGGKTGFRQVTTAEMELKFPEATQLPQMKARYRTAASDTGKKLYIYTDKPYSLKQVMTSKVLAPIETIKNIYKPAISVKSVPMTQAQKLAKIDDLLSQIADINKSGKNLDAIDGLKLEINYLQNSIDATKTIKTASNLNDIDEALLLASKTDDANELIQASWRAEMIGDFKSADRLREEAERIASREYVRQVIRNSGVQSGLAEYSRALMSIRGIDTSTARPVKTRTPETRTTTTTTRRTTTPARTDNRVITPSITRVLDTRTPDTRTLDARTPEARTPRTPETPETPDTPRTPETPETPDTPRTPETPETPRTPEIPKKELEKLKRPGGKICWRQGFGWWVIKFPYKSEKDMYFTREKPAGAYDVKGIGSAYRTIQVLGGNPQVLLTKNLGIVDVTVKNGAISFKRKKTRTKQDKPSMLKGVRR